MVSNARTAAWIALTATTLAAEVALASLPATTADLAPQAPALAADFQDDVMDVTLEELRDFKYRRGKKLPKKIRALDGKRVRIKGFMNIDTPEGLEEFQLVSDSCGCDGTSKPHHFVLVQLDGETTTFNPDEITVTGTISIGEEEQDGLVTSVFRIKAESVE